MAGGRVISAVLTLKDKDFTATAKKSASAMTDFERRTKHSSNAVKKFGSSAASNFKKVGLGAASIVTAIGVTKALSGALNMVRNSVGSALDRIDTMERFERTMTTMLGSTEAAKSALDGLNDVVTGTAYGLDTAASSVQNFVSRGVEVEKATSWFETMGDAVAFFGDGSNEQLESVTQAMSKMVTKGKVNMQQMETLTLAGIDAVGIYAKAVGKETTDIEKDLTSGAVTAEEFFDVVTKAMNEGTNGVQKVAGTAKDAGATWKGAIDNMKFAVVRGVQGIILSIDEMLENNGLPSMREMVTDFGKKFESVLKGSADNIQPFIDVAKDMFEEVQPVFGWLKDIALPAVKGELVEMYEVSKPGLEWLKDEAFPGIVDAVVFVTESVTGMYNFIKDNLPLIAPVVAGVVAAMLTYKAIVTGISIATGIWKGVTTVATLAQAGLNAVLLANPIGLVVAAIGILVGAGVALYMNFDKVKAAASWLWEKLQENPMLALVAGPFGALIAAGVTLYNNFDKIKAAFDRFKNAISKFKLPKWVSTVGSALGSAAGKVKGMFGGGPQESFAVGTNAVREDMVAQVHKGEMIVPAKQSRNLRNQGVNINNIDKGGLRSRVQPSRSSGGKSISIAKLAEQIVVREESDIDKITTMLVRKLEDVSFNMA